MNLGTSLKNGRFQMDNLNENLRLKGKYISAFLYVNCKQKSLWVLTAHLRKSEFELQELFLLSI